MMQKYLGIIGLLFFIYACSNDLKTIGQDIVYNGNNISSTDIPVINTATIRLDSFVTSSGLYNPEIFPPSKIIAGKYAEPHGGTTTAIPCFQVVPPSYSVYVGEEATLDSAYLRIHWAKNIWGDTVYDVKYQTFDLYQLKEVPYVNPDPAYNGFFYNTSSVDYDPERRLATATFLPKIKHINDASFRIDDKFAKEIFEEMRYRSDNSFFENPEKFREYIKGFALLPHKDNNCLMSLLTQGDSLFIEFAYKDGSDDQRFIKFGCSYSEYLYNTYQTDRSGTPFESLKTQRDEVPLDNAKFALVQGLSGYMTKFRLPTPPGMSQYSTLLKVQLEVRVEYFKDNEIGYPASVVMYRIDDNNEIRDYILNNPKEPVVGMPQQIVTTDERDYVFDMTEYYQNIVDNPGNEEMPEVALAIPNNALSYDYIIIKEEPKVKFYFANYKQ